MSLELLERLRAAFDGDDVPAKNIALRKAHDEIETLRARLSQAGAGGGVVVKPLAYVKPHGSETLTKCETLLGEAVVWTHHEANGSWFWKLGSIASGTEANEADCKKMLWLTYEARILAALAPSPSAGEPWAWARRWAFDEIDVMAMKKADRPRGWQFYDVTRHKIVADDVPLYATPPATPVQPTASVEAADIVYAIREMTGRMEGGKFVQQYALSFEEAQKLVASLTPAPTQGDGERCTYCGDTGTITDRVDGEIACSECGYLAPPAHSGEVLRIALERLRDDCQSTIDLYHRNGPSFTSPGGDEYEPTSFVIEKMEELIAVAIAALNPAPGHGEAER